MRVHLLHSRLSDVFPSTEDYRKRDAVRSVAEGNEATGTENSQTVRKRERRKREEESGPSLPESWIRNNGHCYPWWEETNLSNTDNRRERNLTSNVTRSRYFLYFLNTFNNYAGQHYARNWWYHPLPSVLRLACSLKKKVSIMSWKERERERGKRRKIENSINAFICIVSSSLNLC